MALNWITLSGQIFNFLLLVYLLHRFLFLPVTKAMSERQAHLAQILDEAKKREEAARAAQARYEALFRNLDEERRVLMDEARQEAQQLYASLVQEARDAAQKARDAWEKDLEAAKKEMASEIRRRLADEVELVTKKLLQEIARAPLEDAVVDVFLQKITDLPEEEKNILRTQKKEALLLTTSFSPAMPLKKKLEEGLKKILGEGPIVLRQSPEPILGLEAWAGSHKVSWSAREMLDEIMAGWQAKEGQRREESTHA